MRFAVGVILAALASFVWGMVYWGANPLPYTSWKQAPDDAAAGRALREHFPESGTYYVPGMRHEPETLARLYRNGPVAFVHVTARDGRPQHDPLVMVKGLALYLTAAFVLGLLVRMVAPALHTFGRQAGFAVLGGAAAALLIDGGDAVFWYLPAAWKLHQAVYDFTAWTIAVLVLGRFVRPTS